ncbi:MAG: isopentenyl-diphosphate Delta-isomerase [Candidatus Phosphoribacter sp.]
MPAPSETESPELVVLLDGVGRAIGVADKLTVHHDDTPLHLALSCYVVDADDRLLVTRRALDKATFPGLLTNSVCGHPAPGERLTDAVCRRAAAELGLHLHLSQLRVVLPGYGYRASMDGIVEHERCPVFVAVVERDPPLAADPREVAEARWVPWADFSAQVRAGELAVSPWCREQVGLLDALGASPQLWPTGDTSLLPPAARL